jgi:hypothetical protein
MRSKISKIMRFGEMNSEIKKRLTFVQESPPNMEAEAFSPGRNHMSTYSIDCDVSAHQTGRYWVKHLNVDLKTVTFVDLYTLPEKLFGVKKDEGGAELMRLLHAFSGNDFAGRINGAGIGVETVYGIVLKMSAKVSGDWLKDSSDENLVNYVMDEIVNLKPELENMVS